MVLCLNIPPFFWWFTESRCYPLNEKLLICQTQTRDSENEDKAEPVTVERDPSRQAGQSAKSSGRKPRNKTIDRNMRRIQPDTRARWYKDTQQKVQQNKIILMMSKIKTVITILIIYES